MFVANITTAITKASEKIFDIRDNEGTLKGGSLKLKKFKVLWLLFSRFFSLIRNIWFGSLWWMKKDFQINKGPRFRLCIVKYNICWPRFASILLMLIDNSFRDLSNFFLKVDYCFLNFFIAQNAWTSLIIHNQWSGKIECESTLNSS